MTKVFCIGEMLIDLIAEANFDKAKIFTRNPGGAPANVAVQIAKLGGEAYFLGNLGDDSFGYYLLKILQEFGVFTEYVTMHGQTTLAFVGIDNSGEREFEFYRGSDVDYQLTTTQLSDSLIKNAPIIHFGSATAFLGGNLEDSYLRLLDYALEYNLFISFDPNFRQNLIYDGMLRKYINTCQKFISCASFIKLSELELQIISGEDDIEDGIASLSKLTNGVIAVTLGVGGTILAYNNQQIHLPTRQVAQVDSTGAGDAFVGAVLYQLANCEDKSWEDIILFANFVGGYTVQRHGAILAMPTMEQIQRFINE